MDFAMSRPARTAFNEGNFVEALGSIANPFSCWRFHSFLFHSCSSFGVIELDILPVIEKPLDIASAIKSSLLYERGARCSNEAAEAVLLG